MNRQAEGAGVLIVGAGAAGVAAANELRAQGFDGPVTVVNGERVAPYNRTTVNKGLLDGSMSLQSVALAAPEDDATRWIVGDRAVRLDLSDRRVQLESGVQVGYDALLLTTGARPRTIGVPVPPSLAERVRVLRTADDAARFRGLLDRARGLRGPAGVRVGIVGAGLIGAETADSLVAAGVQVTLVDAAQRPLERQLGPTVAGWVRSRQEQQLRPAFGTRVTALAAEDGEARVQLSDGHQFPVDLVLVALGVQPEVEWLGCLAHAGGVAVDDRLRATVTERVYVAGDLALVDGPGGPSRAEHWGLAMAQGRHAARSLLHDRGAAPDPGPFTAARSFATRLYGKAVTVLEGPGAGDREVVLARDTERGATTVAFVDADDRLTAVVALGSPKLANRLRPLVATAEHLARAIELVEPASEPGRV